MTSYLPMTPLKGLKTNSSKIAPWVKIYFQHMVGSNLYMWYVTMLFPFSLQALKGLWSYSSHANAFACTSLCHYEVCFCSEHNKWQWCTVPEYKLTESLEIANCDCRLCLSLICCTVAEIVILSMAWTWYPSIIFLSENWSSAMPMTNLS